MSASTATPPVPPRPTRAQATAAAVGAAKLPEVPPRPVNKRLDRSVSPGNNYPRSPLYDPPTSSSLNRPKTFETPSAPLARVPSVQNLPLVGQEGDEYANIQYAPVQPSSTLGADAAEQTRSIGEDLKLHAPKPSLPQASAKAQVQAVTRTDTHQAISPGYGKAPSPSHDDYEHLQQLRSRSSFSRPGSTASGERRTSSYVEDHGPAETGGMRVPINPLLGDVQAPSPAPFGSQLTPTHTGGNEMNRSRKHHRTKSGREVFLPPGSYGLHGHGVAPQDRFEQDWYQKHPEQLQNEEKFGHGVYESIGSGRGNFALSSDDLNKIVRNTASRGSGTNTNAMSYPDEQIGYMASEQYSQPPNYLSKLHSNHSQPAVESPLRKTSFPADESGRDTFKSSRKSSSDGGDNAFEDEEDGLHVDEPARRYNKITGGEETMHETESTYPYPTRRTSNGGLVDEHGYSVPILASDEVAKHTGSEFMQPAISPKQERRGSLFDHEYRSSGDVTPSSRPASRPGSVYGIQGVNHSLSRFSTHHDDRDNMHTPLEDVAEYEPLFPDEDGNQRPKSHAERFKQRPDYIHRFPSQDIWEDTPDSSMHVATVSTPDLPSQTDKSKQLGSSDSKPTTTFEHPTTESARKGEVGEDEKKKLIPKEERLARSHFASHLQDEMPMRPGMQPRFPSQDVWEDSPDSQHLVTTVGGPQMDEETSPVESKPSIPPRPVAKSKLGEGAPSTQIAPSIPARPTKKYQVPPTDAKLSDLSVPPPTESANKETSPTERKAPVIPDRPKPQIPARPQKKLSGDNLTKTISSGSTETEKGITSPNLGKVKPQVPARPVGSKISSLKGNFMNDLNQKLGLGPPKDKEPEPEVEQEVKPLEDARKGRARGPQRRAPAKSPSTSAESAPIKSSGLGLSTPTSLWHIHPDDGSVNVHGSKREATPLESMPLLEVKPSLSEEKVQQMGHATVADAPPPVTIDTTISKTADAPSATNIAKNTAGELADPDFVARPAAPTQEKSDPMLHTFQPLEDDSLSQKTTEGSDMKSGHTLTREEPNPNTDAIPLNQHTTADTSVSGATLEKAETHPTIVNALVEEEEKVIRDEQVKAPAPGSNDGPVKEKFSSVAGQGGRSDTAVGDEEAIKSKTVEPMDEDDVSYKRLEEMTAKADGKGHAEEEGGAVKVVE